MDHHQGLGEEEVEEALSSPDPWHCANGHVIFVTPRGRGCMKRDCVYSILRENHASKRKPKEFKEVEVEDDE